VVKFRNKEGDTDAQNRNKDEESHDNGFRNSGVEMVARVVDASHMDEAGNEDRAITAGIPARSTTEDGVDEVPRDRPNTASGSGQYTDITAELPRQRDNDVTSPDKEIVPDAIGRETCPICIIDFTEGDDLRLLPCEGKHAFHKECVDPWLLELSSSCPICRQGTNQYKKPLNDKLIIVSDFQALETLLSGESDDGVHGSQNTPNRGSGLYQGNRFSRYLRFARRRNRERETDPNYL
jgi:hypothetical protein